MVVLERWRGNNDEGRNGDQELRCELLNWSHLQGKVFEVHHHQREERNEGSNEEEVLFLLVGSLALLSKHTFQHVAPSRSAVEI